MARITFPVIDQVVVDLCKRVNIADASRALYQPCETALFDNGVTGEAWAASP
jgi:hypothetical protein